MIFKNTCPVWFNNITLDQSILVKITPPTSRVPVYYYFSSYELFRLLTSCPITRWNSQYEYISLSCVSSIDIFLRNSQTQTEIEDIDDDNDATHSLPELKSDISELVQLENAHKLSWCQGSFYEHHHSPIRSLPRMRNEIVDPTGLMIAVRNQTAPTRRINIGGIPFFPLTAPITLVEDAEHSNIIKRAYNHLQDLCQTGFWPSL